MPSFLPSSSEVARKIHDVDWSGSELGPPDQWPDLLKSALGTLLRSEHALFLFWGSASLCFYNDAYARTLGPERHPSILGLGGAQAWAEIWHVIGPQIEQVLAGGPSTWHENQLIPVTRRGEQAQAYWTYSFCPLYDAHAPAPVAGVLVIVTETTSQVTADLALREAEQRWRALFDQAPSFIAVLDGPQHRFTYTNRRYRRLVGRDHFLDRPVAEAMPEVVPQGFIDLLDRVYESGTPFVGTAMPVTLRGARGEREVLVDFIYQPIRTSAGTITGILVEGVDVTERCEAEEALRRANDRLTLATDAAQLGIYEWNPRTGDIAWDARMRAIWGVESDEAFTYDRFRDSLVADDVPAMEQALRRALDPGGDGRYLAQYRVTHGEGQLRWIRATGQVVFRDGEPERLTGTVEDVSEAKAIERTLRESDRRKTEFLAMLSHELRNPLSAMSSATEILGRDDARPEARDLALQILGRQQQHLQRLLDDMLDISRLSAGKIRMVWAVVPLESVIANAIELAQTSLTQNKHTLEIDVPEGRFQVRADTVRLAQVFANLLGNAAKYTPGPGQVRIRAYADAEGVRVEVSDDGIGLTIDAQQQIFDMFAQVSGEAERSRGGLGIGLAIAKGLVREHGGTIDVRSAGPGQGSTFRVWLPLASDG